MKHKILGGNITKWGLFSNIVSSAVLGSHWSNKSSTVDMMSALHILFSLHSYLIHKWDPNNYDDSKSEQTWVSWQWRDTLHTPNLLKWSLNIKCNLVLYVGYSFTLLNISSMIAEFLVSVVIRGHFTVRKLNPGHFSCITVQHKCL